ncbi:helix-turn-helix domain-containing protein [Ideonella livida]|uniref:Helix-turn-helix domain-containing protein n=1 Tax=Ideonella livida TaxID=2707176 RepID=A0A7C9PFI5_9BURK|nr:helix-turn-helix domain-containing protein [Ideonella livida]NDY89774.1 helix-turn-helix domain-containing protein [Ideonella livida]
MNSQIQPSTQFIVIQAPPTVDLAGAAELMKVHPESVREMIQTGELAAGQLGRGYVIRTADVMALVDRSVMEQTAARVAARQRSGLPTAGVVAKSPARRVLGRAPK